MAKASATRRLPLNANIAMTILATDAKMSAMIISFAYLISIASALPADASALESALSALVNEITTLESRSEFWEKSLPWFTGLVVLGLAADAVVIIWERRDEIAAYRLWIYQAFHPAERPLRWKFALELLASAAILLGVAGELSASAAIASINGQLRIKNGQLRDKSNQLVALLNGETAQLHKEAEAERLARVKIEARVAWRHLTDNQKSAIGSKLGDFSNQEGASLWYQTGDTESATFAVDIAEALKKSHIVVQPPAGVTIMRGIGKFGDPIKRIDTGVILQSTKDARSRSLAEAIIRELNLQGFDARRQTDPPFDDRPIPQVWVNVSPRPEGPQGEFKLEAEQEAKAKKKQVQIPQTNR